MCPKCAADADVLETRKDGYLIRRRRLCHNGHRFSTVELPSPLVKAVSSSRMQRTMQAYANSAEMFRRDRSIYLEYRQTGLSHAALARQFGISESSIRKIISKQRRLRGE